MRRSHLIAIGLLMALSPAFAQGAGQAPVVAVQVERDAPVTDGAEVDGREADETVSVDDLPQTAAEPGIEIEPDIAALPEDPTLEELRWVARPIVVFADTENDPRFRQQMEMLERNSGDLVARDVVILVDTDAGTLSPLRKELRPHDFNLVLIDKDGTVVQRRPAPTTVRELTHLIDRLPSRRMETGSIRQ